MSGVEGDSPCGSFGTEVILPRASPLDGAFFCTDFRDLPHLDGRGTDLYGQRSRKPQMRGRRGERIILSHLMRNDHLMMKAGSVSAHSDLV